MKNFIKSNTFYAVLSIIIAILIWVYVVYEVRPSYEMWVKDIPITCTNTSRLFDEGSLKIRGDYASLITGDFTVDVKIRGSRGLVSSVDSDNISCTLDMITVDKSGSYNLKPQVEVDVSGVIISKITPSSVKFHVDSINQTDIEVELVTKGELPEGYEFENLKAKTDEVKITGPENVIGSVSRAYIELDCSSLSETDTEKSLLINFEDKNGEAIDSTQFSKSMEYVKVSFNLYTEKEVSVILCPRYKGEERKNRNGQDVTLSCVSEDGKKSGDGVKIKVKLKGSADALDKYLGDDKTVYTKEIDVRDIYSDQTLYSIEAAPLPNNVEYIEAPSVDVKAVIKPQE